MTSVENPYQSPSENRTDQTPSDNHTESSAPARPALHEWVVSVLIISAAAYYFVWSLLLLLGSRSLVEDYRNTAAGLIFLIWSGTTSLFVVILHTSYGYRGRPAPLRGFTYAIIVGVSVSVVAVVAVKALT